MSTLYIHWPFCLSKCFYCDFYSVPCNGDLDYVQWLSLYKNVLKQYQYELYKGESITSVYFGGGTPSLLPEFFVDDLLSFISSSFKLANDAEVTIEANPSTISEEKMKSFKESGINRISIGIQSFVDKDLKMLGRIHDSFEALECLEAADKFFDNISIDLIYNRPGQNLSDWENELTFALQLPINHISLYELIVEDGTRIQRMISDGTIPAPDPGSEFMERTMEITSNAGFEMYEISNFSKPGYQGRHNLSYWRYEDYFGVGPSSHSRILHSGKKLAIEQVANNEIWQMWAKAPELIGDSDELTEEEIFQEKLIFGLRSKIGVDLNGVSDALKNKLDFQNKVENLVKNLYIIIDNGVVKLTQDGILKLNLIIEYLAREREI